jgi:hypothetical protein
MIISWLDNQTSKLLATCEIPLLRRSVLSNSDLRLQANGREALAVHIFFSL